jgi:hypothetical protein
MMFHHIQTCQCKGSKETKWGYKQVSQHAPQEKKNHTPLLIENIHTYIFHSQTCHIFAFFTMTDSYFTLYRKYMEVCRR